MARLKFVLNQTKKENYISIKKVINNNVYYWKINDINKRIVLTNSTEIDIKDNNSVNTVLFEMIEPMEFKEEEIAEEPIPTENDDEKDNNDEMDKKKKELETLELDIRELQHNQNLKLMDVMVDVNKFKLMDMSLSDYLTKCNNNSSDNNIQVVNNNKNNNKIKYNKNLNNFP